MRRIFCHSNNRNTYIDFYEFEFEKHLKEFSDLFTMSSGVKILEYKQGPGTTLAVTDNSNFEVNILWDDMCGCSIYALNENRIELVKVCYKMLCIKYPDYFLFSDLFNSIEEKTSKNKLKIDPEILNSGKKEIKDNEKRDMLQDLSELILLINDYKLPADE